MSLDLDSLGEFKSYAETASTVVSAGIALVSIIAGKYVWAPRTTGLPGYASQISGVLTGLGLLYLVARSRSVLDAPDFLLWAVILGAVGLVGVILYLFARIVLIIECPGDPTRYVAGLCLKANARKVLRGDLEGLPPEYGKIGGPPPTNVQDYFCRSGKDPNFIWNRGCYALSQILLLLAYFLFIIPLALAIASGGIGMNQIKIEKTPTATKIELPASILFAFNKADLQENADTLLQHIASDLKDHKVRKLRIEGHSDAVGDDAYNKDLSERRAKAVEQWLKTQGGLADVAITAVGLGKADATVPASASDAERAKDRRVTIVVERQQ